MYVKRYQRYCEFYLKKKKKPNTTVQLALEKTKNKKSKESSSYTSIKIIPIFHKQKNRRIFKA